MTTQTLIRLVVLALLTTLLVAWSHGGPTVPCVSGLNFSLACNSQYVSVLGLM